MKIYLAGNTPDREREEKILIDKGLSKRRLLSYHYYLIDQSVRKMVKLWGIG